MKRLDALHWTLLLTTVCLLILSTYLAISPYRYFPVAEPNGQLLMIRVSRFTGEAERLSSSGWKPLRAVAR